MADFGRYENSSETISPSGMRVQVILDSNFLMLSTVFSGSVWDELDRVIGRRTEKIVLDAVYQEVQRLSKEAGLSVSKQATAALRLVDREDFRQVHVERRTGETVDHLILRIAKAWICFVATNDRELRKKLISSQVPVVYLRQGSRLEARGRLSSRKRED